MVQNIRLKFFRPRERRRSAIYSTVKHKNWLKDLPSVYGTGEEIILPLCSSRKWRLRERIVALVHYPSATCVLSEQRYFRKLRERECVKRTRRL